MNRDRVPQIEPQIENPKNLPLPAAAETILKQMFATHRRVVIKAELGGGFSGSRVFVVQPIRDTPELPVVIKMGPVELLEKEYRAYRKYIHDRLAGAAEITGEPILDPGGDWGGLRYQLVGGGIFEVESLHNFCRGASAKDIWHVLEKRLFRCLGPLWRFSDLYPQFDLRASYDRVLPVNLLIEPSPTPPDARLHLLKPGALSSQPLQRGDYVRLEGFVITEVDRGYQAVTLNLPPTADDLPASYRLRLQPVKTPWPFQVNEVLESVEGVVTATRYDLLQTQVEQVLHQDLAAETLTLRGEASIVLPNPLAVLQDVLGETRNVRVACIHGDLNLENILVDPDARDVRLVDFAMARRDHVLHDLLRLETGVVTWLLPEALAKAGLPPGTIHSLYEQLHCAARLGHFSASQQLHLVLRKTFVMLATIRKMARDYLFDPDDWSEYYQGLTLYLLGALKFKNLDDMPQTPLPKQMAFWGAAAIQRLLQEPPPCEEMMWQPLATLIDDLPGQLLGRYEIVELIGEGGTASVYRARELGLARDVAVKVLLPRLAADPVFRRRFEREAQSIARLRHPNILTIYDYGRTDDGRPYLVLDYVEGGTLRERLQGEATSSSAGGRTMPLEEAVEIVSRVADALDYAHDQGMIHRDVKPSNILLTPDGHPLLADFGLAKPIKSEQHLTRSGVLLGTVYYMAPEQAQGFPVDGRADIYALGVTLFEILAGQRPYEGEPPFNVIFKLIHEPMPRPSKLNPAVPPALDKVVARATASLPDERYQRAEDMVAALEKAMEEIRVGERKPFLWPRLPTWAWGAAIGVVVTLLAVVGGLFTAVKPTPTVVQATNPPVTLAPGPGSPTVSLELFVALPPTSTPTSAGPTSTPTIAIDTTQTALAAEVKATLMAEASATAQAFAPMLTVTPTPIPTPVPPTATATHAPQPPTLTPVPTLAPQPAGPIALTIYLRDTVTEAGFVALSDDQHNGGMIYEEGKYVYGDAAVQIGNTVYHFHESNVEPDGQLPDPWQVEFEFAEELLAHIIGDEAGFDSKKAQFWVGRLDGSSAIGEDRPYSLTMRLYEGDEVRESIQVFFTVADAPGGGEGGEEGGGGGGKPKPP